MILIEGPNRSGTSIVGELLRDHSNCTQYLYEQWWPFSFADLGRPGTVAKMPRHFLPAPGLGCDPLRLPPGPTIWIERDPVDIVRSLYPVMKDTWGAWPLAPMARMYRCWVDRACAYVTYVLDEGWDSIKTRDPLVIHYEVVKHSPGVAAGMILNHVQWQWENSTDDWCYRVEHRIPAERQNEWNSDHKLTTEELDRIREWFR